MRAQRPAGLVTTETLAILGAMGAAVVVMSGVLFWVKPWSKMVDPRALPDTVHTQAYSGDRYAFTYPGNWHVRRQQSDDGPEIVHVMSIESGAAVRFMVTDEPGDLGELLDEMRSELREWVKDYQEQQRLMRYGSFDARGVAYMESERFPHEVRRYLTRLPDGALLQVTEECRRGQRATVESGFELISSTLVAR